MEKIVEKDKNWSKFIITCLKSRVNSSQKYVKMQKID